MAIHKQLKYNDFSKDRKKAIQEIENKNKKEEVQTDLLNIKR